MRVLVVALLIVAVAHAEYHSSLHVHKQPHHHGDSWSIGLPAEGDPDAVVRAINAQLTTGTISIARVLQKDPRVMVVHTDGSLQHDELALILHSEQRGGAIPWFHRDGVSHRHHH